MYWVRERWKDEREEGISRIISQRPALRGLTKIYLVGLVIRPLAVAGLI